jgi:cytosine/adenosine deaminase-related metal-dependent hydrolase
VLWEKERRRLPPTTLIRSCDVVVVMDDAGTEIRNGSILIAEGRIDFVGEGGADGVKIDQEVDGRGTVAIPGLINTHHHLFQSLTRVHAQADGLFSWIRRLYPKWQQLSSEWVRVADRVALAELAVSGCSTTADHHSLFPAGVSGLMETEVEVAREIGLRLHLCRGSIDFKTPDGIRGAGGSHAQVDDPRPRNLIEETTSALERTASLIDRFHDPSQGAMVNVAIAPTSLASCSERIWKESVQLALQKKVRLHTHLAESPEERSYCIDRFGCEPIEFLENVGFLGPHAWLAHCVHLTEADIKRIADAQTAVAWCPSSNLRCGVGIAPIDAFLKQGVTVGLGVDGAASNDASNLISEARQAMLLGRATRAGLEAMSARTALRLATRGGAACLGRADIGSLEPGRQADVALFDVEGLEFAGADADVVAALVYCSTRRARDLFVQGRRVVSDGRLITADEDEIAAEGHRFGRRIAGRS